MEGDPSYGGEIWFLTGLVSFLIGHIYFIFAMRNRLQEHQNRGIPNTNHWALPVIVIFAISMTSVICPNVDDLVL